MSQLSSFSRNTLNTIGRLLGCIEKVLRFLRTVLFKKIPSVMVDVVYCLQALKDIASIVPSYIYKSICALVVFAVVRYKVRKYHSCSRPYQQIKMQKSRTKHLDKSQIFNNLGAQFEVKEKILPTQVCDAVEEDSCCVDLKEQLEKQPQDFRDIVFFELMRGYRSSFAKQSRSLSKKLQEQE